MCFCVCVSWSHHLYLHCKEGRRLQQGLMPPRLWTYVVQMTTQQGCCSRLQHERANTRTQDGLSLHMSLAMLVHDCQAQSHRSLEGYPGSRIPYSGQSLLVMVYMDHQSDPVHLLSRSLCSYTYTSPNLRDGIGLTLSYRTVMHVLCTVGWNQRAQTRVLCLFVQNTIKRTTLRPSSPVLWLTAVT